MTDTTQTALVEQVKWTAIRRREAGDHTAANIIEKLIAALASQSQCDADLLREAAGIVHGAMVWAAQQGGEPTGWQDGNSFAEDKARDAARKITARLSAPASDEWQPIETAPKDGMPFVGSDGKYAYRTRIGKYYVKFPHEDGGPSYDEKWNAEDSGSVWPWHPTHWMPLPEARASLASKDQS